MNVFQVKIYEGIGGQNQVVHYIPILPKDKDMLLSFYKLRQRRAKKFVTNIGIKPCYVLKYVDPF